ncbi:MAG: virulence factor [Anaerolineales bacterium]|nr:virulence factor [Anaerolineales bacterium]
MNMKFQIIYWRDIPAQVKVQAGRRERATRELSQRFQVAIDEAAMRAGFTDTDAYLAEWRASDWEERDGELEPLADELAAELEASYPPERVRAIMANGGFES